MFFSGRYGRSSISVVSMASIASMLFPGSQNGGTVPYKAIEIGGISPYMAPTLALYMVGTSKLGSWNGHWIYDIFRRVASGGHFENRCGLLRLRFAPSPPSPQGALRCGCCGWRSKPCLGKLQNPLGRRNNPYMVRKMLRGMVKKSYTIDMMGI